MNKLAIIALMMAGTATAYTDDFTVPDAFDFLADTVGGTTFQLLSNTLGFLPLMFIAIIGLLFVGLALRVALKVLKVVI